MELNRDSAGTESKLHTHYLCRCVCFTVCLCFCCWHRLSIELHRISLFSITHKNHSYVNMRKNHSTYVCECVYIMYCQVSLKDHKPLN